MTPRAGEQLDEGGLVVGADEAVVHVVEQLGRVDVLEDVVQLTGGRLAQQRHRVPTLR